MSSVSALLVSPPISNLPNASSPLPPSVAQASANGRAVSGGFNFFPRAAGVGAQQFDKVGFDKVGPSSQGWAQAKQQPDGSWRTEIRVPYGKQLGGNAPMDSGTDRRTTMVFSSLQPPTLNSEGRLFISGHEISGDFLEGQLAKLGLPPPDWREFVLGGDYTD